MFIGTQYHRPPHPKRSDWERDMDNIVASGLTLIRIWVYWSQVNPRPDQWRWSETDAFLDEAQKHGLRVLIQLMPDAMPYWFKDRHPEALFLDRDGNIVQPSAGAAMAVGGFPGPNYDHPVAQEAGGEFIRRTVERYAQHPALHAWDVWNELWPFVMSRFSALHGDATLEKWRRWLEAEYGDIGALNEHWMRSYASFDEVEWPLTGVHADLGTRFRFDQQRVADWMTWRAEQVRVHDTKNRVVSHTGGIGPVSRLGDPFGPDPTDPWLFTEALDVWGTTCYMTDYREWSFLLDSTRSSAQGRPYWVSEMNGGKGHIMPPSLLPGAGLYSNYLRTPEEIRSQVLLTFSHGGEGVVFWQWRPEQFGPESPGWGLANAAGDLTDRTEALKGLNVMLNKHEALLEGAEFPAPEAAILWEPKSYQLEMLSGWRPDFGYLGGIELLGYHKALTALGLPVEYLNGRVIVERGIPDHVKLLFHPYPAADRSGLAERVRAWVEAGGTLVAGPGVGLFDDRLNGSPVIPPEAWREVLGVRYYETYYPDEPVVQLLAGTTRQLAGYHLVEAYHLEGADPVGTWGPHVTMAQRRLGNGRAITVGTFLGQPLAHEKSSDLAAWVAGLCDEADVRPAAYATGGSVFSRVATSGDTVLLFVHNPAAAPASTWLNAPGLSAEVTNLVTGAAVGTIGPRTPLSVTLAAKDSTLFALKP